MLKNKTLLITGGTGSFGNAVLNRFLAADVGEIRIFSRNEDEMFELLLKLDFVRTTLETGKITLQETSKNGQRSEVRGQRTAKGSDE